ncbi:VanZ family protein [Sporolactobacillus laevolacticus]|uniref:VanZ family protein n=1 Tax=Sporolactobacillus laevolacticus TaxID=33018 RepID=UPI0025B4D9B0|nr:VanZ family protein [Sporolactobacillus laevolacticus]MDN3956360.1 VanZ family protein [Sporolactobacillus laevolacticus]
MVRGAEPIWLLSTFGKWREWMYRQQPLKLLLISFLFVYVLMLLKDSVVGDRSISTLLTHWHEREEMRFINWVPLNIITTLFYFSDHHDQRLWQSLLELFITFSAFLPLGYLLPAIRTKPIEFEQFIAIPVGLSLLIEAGQYILGTGRCDIDDLILNVLGAITGFVIWHLLSEWVPVRCARSRILVIITVLFFIFWLAVQQVQKTTVPNLSEYDPKIGAYSLSIPDYSGDYLSGNVQGMEIRLDKDQGNVQVQIAISRSTQLFIEHVSAHFGFSPASYKPIQANRMSRIPEHTKVKIWGRQINDQFFAEFVILQYG